MIRALVINDVHLAASPPMGCTERYTDDIKNMLVEARQYARDNDCAYTIFTGDFFHSKRGTPPGLIRWAMETLQEWPGRKLAIVGNHDQSYRGLDSIPDQPIGLLFQEGALEWLREDIVTCDRISTPDGPTISTDLFIQWSPANYFPEIDHDPANFSLTRRHAQMQQPMPRDDARSVDWAVKIAHGTITPPGKPFPYHTVPMDTIDTTGMDICLYGHPHYDVGLNEVNGCTFVCLGSLGRTQANEDEYGRVMRLLQVQFGKDDFFLDELLLGSAAPATELFLAKSAKGHDEDRALSRLMKHIDATTLIEQGSVDEVLATLPGDGRAKKRLVDYLQKAGL